MCNNDNRYQWAQIALGIATLLFTPLLSGLVIRYQLSRDHNYRSWERHTAKAEWYMKEQLALMHRIDAKVLELLHLKTRQDIAKKSMGYNMYAFGMLSSDAVDSVNEVNALAEEYSRQFLVIAADVQLCSVLFSPSAAAAAKEIGVALTKDVTAGYDPYVVSNRFATGVASGNTALAISKQLAAEYSGIHPTNTEIARIHMLSLMYKDINDASLEWSK